MATGPSPVPSSSIPIPTATATASAPTPSTSTAGGHGGGATPSGVVVKKKSVVLGVIGVILLILLNVGNIAYDNYRATRKMEHNETIGGMRATEAERDVMLAQAQNDALVELRKLQRAGANVPPSAIQAVVSNMPKPTAQPAQQQGQSNGQSVGQVAVQQSSLVAVSEGCATVEDLQRFLQNHSIQSFGSDVTITSGCVFVRFGFPVRNIEGSGYVIDHLNDFSQVADRSAISDKCNSSILCIAFIAQYMVMDAGTPFRITVQNGGSVTFRQ